MALKKIDNPSQLLWKLLPIIFFISVCQLPLHPDNFSGVKQQILQNSWYNRSPFYISTSLFINNLGYNSNVNSFLKMEKSDITADAGGIVGLAFVVKNRFIIKLEDMPIYSYYAKEERERKLNNKFQGSIYTHFGKFNLHYTVNLSRNRERPNNEFGARTNIKERSHLVNLDYGRQDSFFFRLTAEQNTREYEDTQYMNQYNLTIMNQEDRRVKLSISKRIFTRSMLFINADYYQNRFRYSPQNNGSGNIALIGLNLPQISRLTGTLNFGIKYFNPSNHSRGYTKPVGSGVLGIRLFSRVRFNISYFLDQSFSFLGESQYFFNKSVGFALVYMFSRRIAFSTQYISGKLTFQKLGGNLETRDDVFRTITVNTSIQILKKMAGTLTYTYSNSSSSNAEFRQKYFLVGGSIRYEF